MIKQYKGNGKRFFDLSGYGHEGQIEGLTRDELLLMNEEIEETLNDTIDVSATMDRFDELMRSFKCGSGHGISCDCEGRKKSTGGAK